MFRAPDRIFSSVFLFFFLLSSHVSAAEVRGYDDLLSALRVEQSSPQDRVAASWKMGKLMEQDAEAHKLWADYSEELNQRLAQDLRLSVDEIRDLRQFARVFPEMPSPALGWAHYMVLVYVHPDEKRTEFMERALREHWPSETLRLEVRKFREEQKKTFKTERDISKAPGEINTYRVIKAVNGAYEGKLVLDLGFGLQKRLDENTLLTEGDFVDENLQRVSPGEEKLFTYAAAVTKIIDGDTFAASVDLGFGLSVKQIFRLNGVDAPELESSLRHGMTESRQQAPGSPETGEGVTAKTFVYDEIMRAGGKVVLRAGQPDKYNRILADVWVSSARNVQVSADSTQLTKAEWGNESLNQKLLEQHHAIKAAQ